MPDLADETRYRLGRILFAKGPGGRYNCYVQRLNAPKMPSVGDETRYRLLKYLSEHPDASQRDLARHLGVSLGKINYCLAALVSKGWVKVQNFKRSQQKSAYLYVLTATGLEEKVNVTHTFWKREMAEYDALLEEIESLSSEIQHLPEEKRTSR